MYLKDETIDINVRIGVIRFFEIEYSCNYTLVNQKNSNQKILIGFPIKLNRVGDKLNPNVHGRRTDVYDLKISVNNKELADNKIKKEQLRGKIKQLNKIRKLVVPVLSPVIIKTKS